jgi:hypothetical protein
MGFEVCPGKILKAFCRFPLEPDGDKSIHIFDFFDAFDVNPSQFTGAFGAFDAN